MCICLCHVRVSVCLCVCVCSLRGHIIAVSQLWEQMLGIVNTGAKTVPEALESNENVPAVL